jgi:hypothetical protein
MNSFCFIAFPYPLWNNFTFPTSSPSSTRRFNIPPPPPPPLPISPYHSNAAGVLSHPAAAAAAAACMHPAFNYIFNRPETMPKTPLVNNRTNYYNPHQHQSSRNREISASSSSSTSSYCPDITSGLPPKTKYSFQYLCFSSSKNFTKVGS